MSFRVEGNTISYSSSCEGFNPINRALLLIHYVGYWGSAYVLWLGCRQSVQLLLEEVKTTRPNQWPNGSTMNRSFQVRGMVSLKQNLVLGSKVSIPFTSVLWGIYNFSFERNSSYSESNCTQISSKFRGSDAFMASFFHWVILLILHLVPSLFYSLLIWRSGNTRLCSWSLLDHGPSPAQFKSFPRSLDGAYTCGYENQAAMWGWFFGSLREY